MHSPYPRLTFPYHPYLPLHPLTFPVNLPYPTPICPLLSSYHPPSFPLHSPYLPRTLTYNSTPQKRSHHAAYVLHFPLPQPMTSQCDDDYLHEANQRLVVLFGFGKLRDETKSACKRSQKDNLKLFSKKSWLITTIIFTKLSTII